MDNDTAGQLGESAVTFALDSTRYLKTNIIGGKYPIWDGEVLVYDSQDNHSNEHLVGRVPCQIKAKQKGPKLPILKRKARVRDLRHFRSENGAIYLGVLLTHTHEPVLCYKTLLPFDLDRLIDIAGDQETVNIDLCEIRGNDRKVADVFLGFIKNRERQRSLPPGIPREIDELVNAGFSLNEEPVAWIDTLSEEWPESLSDILPNDLYAYAEIDAFGKMLVPIGHIEGIADVTVSRRLDVPVTIGGRLHYDHVSAVRGDDYVAVDFGSCFRIMLRDSRFTINYTPATYLRDRIAGESALFDLAESRRITINSSEFRLDEMPGSLTIDSHDRKESLSFLRDCQAALDKLGCVKELDLTMMDDAHWHRLRVLTNCVILGASMRIPAAQKELSKVVFMDAEIGNLVIRIACTRNESDTYVPKSYFEGKWAYSASGEVDDMTPVSPYCTIEGEAFCRLSNVDIAAVAEDMLRYDEPRQLAIVNDAMLSIVSAYDSSRDATLLKLAGDIATGLLQKLPDDTLALINTMQVRQRDGSLDEDDRELLHLGIESGSYSQTELTAAYTVLGNGRMAKRHFQRMAPRDQEEFEKYPIATLYERLQQ